MRSLFSFCTLILLWSCCFGQSAPKNYEPIRYTPIALETLESLRLAFEEHLATYSFETKKENKLATEFVTKLHESLSAQNERGSLSGDDPLSAYLQKIVDQMVSANSLKKDYFKVFLSVDDIPNAANYGEGVIVFNLGLLSRLNTEGEIAFILAHEMAHDIKDHVFNGIHKKVIALESKEYKKRVKEIEDLEYNQRAAALALQRTYLSEFNEHGRGNELEADSLGLVLMQKAGYFVEDALTAIDLLDHSDDMPVFQLDYPSYFNFRNFAFNEKWLEKKSTINLGGNLEQYATPDSLKTHPSCKARDASLRIIGNAADYQFDSSKQVSYYALRETAFAERISYYRSTGQFSLMLYYSIWHSQISPDNIFYTNSIGNALYGIYTAQYAHKFSMAVPFPNQKMEPEYAQLLRFFHKLNLTNLEQLYHAYVSERISPAGSDAYSDLLHALSDAIEMNQDPEGRQEIIANYEAKYGDSPYTTYIKNQFPEPKTKRKKWWWKNYSLP